MHMADALMSPAVAGTMYVCSGAAMCYSAKKVRELEQPEKIPVMGVMGAFVFAAQMINFTVPGTGSSGHLCGGMLLSSVLGPEAGFLTMIGVLVIQCLLFADGGLLALGANIWNMSFYGCFFGGLVIWKLMMKNGMSRRKIFAASIAGCVLSLQLGAFSVTLETLASGITQLPFGLFLAAMQPIHLAIGLVEGLITAAVLVFLYEVRPSVLWGSHGGARGPGRLAEEAEPQWSGRRPVAAGDRFSLRQTIATLAVSALAIGGLLSLAASASPDGLEWSLERVAGTAELDAAGGIYEAAANVQEVTAVLPDYGFAGGGTALGTSCSGILGGIAVIAVCVACCYALRLFKNKRNRPQ